MNKTRDEMVEALTLEAINYIREAMLHGDTGLLGDYLELGFIGYSHMDEEELRTEYEETIGEEDDSLSSSLAILRKLATVDEA